MEFNTATKNWNQSEVGRRVGGSARSVLAVQDEEYSVLSAAPGGGGGAEGIRRDSETIY